MRTAIVALAVVAALAGRAAAQPGDVPPPAAAALAGAADALAQGDYAQVVTLASPVADQPDAPKADRAEAHRLLGLAHYFAGDATAAEVDLFAYLQLDLDARLDPTTVPPEAIAFFEDVRARHAAELRKLRPRQRRYVLLNLLPPGGQIQNRGTTRAWIVGGAELVLAAANLSTYFVLRSWCSRNDFTCQSGGADSPDTARKVRLANYLSGIALIGVYLYGVVDGFRGYQRHRRERPVVLSAAPVEGGMVAGMSMSF